MRKVHTETYGGKTIEVFRGWNTERGWPFFTVTIDGAPFVPCDSKKPQAYKSLGLAAGSARRSITKRMTKEEKADILAAEIAELQKKLEALRSL